MQLLEVRVSGARQKTLQAIPRGKSNRLDYPQRLRFVRCLTWFSIFVSVDDFIAG